jgi:hypothetical protein
MKISAIVLSGLFLVTASASPAFAAAAKGGGAGLQAKCRAQAQQSDPGFNQQAAKRRAALYRQCMQSGGR